MPEQLPVWNNPGIEPSTDLKVNGWQPGQKPSAQHFNWFFNRAYKCLEELQGDSSKITELEQTLTELEQTVTLNDEKFNEHLENYVKHPAYAVATGSANAYSVTLNPAPTSYVEGMAISVKINVDNTGPSTIDINGLGAKAIKKSNGNDVSAENLKAGSIYTMRYNGTNFILQGEGSDFSDTDKSNLINSINTIYDM